MMIDYYLITFLDGVYYIGASHGVLVVILVILVKHGCNLCVIDSDGEQGLLVVMGGKVELEHVGATWEIIISMA